MNAMKLVRMEVNEGVATVHIAASENSNAFSSALLDELDFMLDRAVQSAVSVIVFRSTIGVFSAGLDLSGIDEATDEELRGRLVRIEEFLQQVSDLPAFTIAVIDGPAIGAGADFAVACDYRIGTKEARFRFPGLRFGVLLGTGRLCRLVGAQNAQEILIDGTTLVAGRALEIGLLSAIVHPTEHDEFVARIAANACLLDHRVLRGLLAVTRGNENASPQDILKKSIGSKGIGDRIRKYVNSSRNA